MKFQRELLEVYECLCGTRLLERRKAVEKMISLLDNEKVLPNINDENPFSWQRLLETSQNCLRKECEKFATTTTTSKKGAPKGPDRNVELSKDLLVLTVKTAVKQGEEVIKISNLIKYIDGCLKEKMMRICRNDFLVVLKDCILPNFYCLGYCDEEDFILLFTLLKSELESCSTSKSNDIIVFNCFMLLIKHGPSSGFPQHFLREQFPFISKLCQSVNRNEPRPQQECVVEIALHFCKHTAEDNRVSCIKLGEEIFSSMLDLYVASGHDSVLKVNFIEFCLLQVIIHNPNGASEGESLAFASNWHNWKMCIKRMYNLLTLEISKYIKQCVKNTLFFIPDKNATVILDSCVLLFVEVCKQLFKETESPMNYTMSDNFDLTSQSQKRQKIEATLESFVLEIQQSKSWVWVKLIGALLDKYPKLIDEKLFETLLQSLHTLQLEIKDNNTIGYIYECQAILIDVESCLDISNKVDILNIWKLIGDSTLRAAGLNQNIKETQNLLRKLIVRNIINLEAVIQTYTSGVLNITKHHLRTLELVLEHIHFSQLERTKKEELFNSLLNSQNIKDYACFLKRNFAEILVTLMLRQCPDITIINKSITPVPYKTLVEIYAKSNFEVKYMTRNDNQVDANNTKRTYNIDHEMVQILTAKIKSFVESSNTEPLDRLLCIIGLLYNIISCMITYDIIEKDKMEQSQIFVLIKKILSSKQLLEFLEGFKDHSERRLKELLNVISILTEIFSINNNITDVVKELFPLAVFKALFAIINFFQEVAKNRADLEHKVKKDLTEALSKYCLVSNSNKVTTCQSHIMLALAKPDYDFKDETDYDLIMTFLKNIKYASPGYLPHEAIEGILACLHGLCLARYGSSLSSLDILLILRDFYTHLKDLDSEYYKSSAVKLLSPFYLRLSHYGSHIALAILDCIKELCKIDPNCQFSIWNDKEIIKFVPEFLASDYQSVRYKAIEVLVEFIKVSSGTTRLENIHRLEEVFESIYDKNIEVFSVEGELTEERRLDEVVFRAASALYTYVSIIVNCNTWMEESLFAIIKLEHNKKIYSVLNGELMEKAFLALKSKFGSQNFMDKYLENILGKWLQLQYNIDDFQYRFFNCNDKMDFYLKYFDICLPLLLKKDRNDLFSAAKQLKMTEKDVLERCCTKIFGQALVIDINNVGDGFIQKNVEVSYLSHVLGDKLKEILVENIDEVILSLLRAVAYEKVVQTAVFSYREISFQHFNTCLKYIEKFLCNGQSLIDFLNHGKLNKIQNILLQLEVRTYNAIAEDQVKYFHQYTIFVNHIVNNIDHNFKLATFFLRDTIYFLIHMAKNSINNETLCKDVLKYMYSYLRMALTTSTKQFEEFLIFTVNSIKNFALENNAISATCIEILKFLIIDNSHSLVATIEKLDAFPEKPEFEEIKAMHHNIKYSKNGVSLEGEIKSFLEYDDMATRQDSLVHLKTILAREKEQLKCMYDNLDQIRGFSEDCQNSILHRLTSVLVKMSCYPNESVSREAVKCLGELGPANLTTLVLEPEKKVLTIKCNSFELLTGHVVSLLTQYIVDPNINVAKTASDALYVIFKFKEGKKVVDSRHDFGYGVINKNFIIPYENPRRSSSQVRIDLESFSTLVNEPMLWCPSESIDNDQWITSLVLALLNSFDYGCYLKQLVSICAVKAKFCEHILPLLIYLMLSLNNKVVLGTLSMQINEFFAQHWNLTVSSSTDKNLIPVNKKSVKCMLDVVNFIRQQFSFLNKSVDLKLNYLPISKAAEFCSAHFSALLFAELWCQEKIASFEQRNLRDGTPFENGYTFLDYIYENESEETGITLQNILLSAYKAIGDLDALSGCGITFLLRPEHRVEHYKNIGRWDHVMHYYSMQPIKSSDLIHANLIESFKMNQLYQLPLLCMDYSDEPQYECLWRLGQWNTHKKDTFKSNETKSNDYEKYQFYSLKALCDNDQYTLTEAKKQLSTCVINDLKHTSLESSKNLYPILTHLQSLVEIDDWNVAMESRNFDDVLNKWKMQDAITRKNDFQFVEPTAAQRITILGEYIKKDHRLRKPYFEMVLNFADYAKEEHYIRIAENALINIRKIPELDCEIKNELQFREAQLSWLNNDKIIAQQLLRKLCKNEDINPRLKSKVLKLQGEYMAEVYSDRTNILNSFYGSIAYLNEIANQFTTEDYKNLEDTYDKIATFADREYQQIMNHIKSDLFQKKISNMKSSIEMIKSINEQKKRSIDEKKAAIFQERQSKIDENEIKTTMKDKDDVLCLALRFYMKNLTRCDANNIKIFRVIALFLENRDNQKIANDIDKLLPEVPTYKYITMLPQLIPHISENSPDFFSIHINRIIEKCAIDHPHHTLPLLLALVNANKDRDYSDSKVKTPPSDRSLTATSMINKLKNKNEFSQIIAKMQLMSEALIELAYHVDDTKNDRQNEFQIHFSLKIHKIKNFDDILVPTYTLPVSKTNTYKNIVGIVRFEPKYKTVGGINAPKRIECRCTLGKSRPQLVKGQDDLRQDAVMEQVFTIMTNLLSSNKQTKNLIIRTYKIVPLSMRSGILEWVANSMPVGDYLTGSKDEDSIGAHKHFRPKDKTPGFCKAKFKGCVGKPLEEKVKIFNSICKEIKPVFHKFFETYFPQPSVWYERKRAYIHSVATTSMCGYILGIGDRHVSNILIDKQTAEVIHIDFGIAFEQGKCLPTPETVPFRLSRDIVDGMGVSGIEGLFRKSCENTMEVLRANSQTILTILEVLLYDPLYFWTLTTAEANKRQTDDDTYRKTIADDSEEENKNISAKRALLRLSSKLQGTENGKQTSVEQQVGTLIQQAMDPANLCRLFYGWQPYL